MTAKTFAPLRLAFRPLTLSDKALFDRFLPDGITRGCELDFANLYLWGKHEIAVLEDGFLLLSCYGRAAMYRYPFGSVDPRLAVDAMIEDAAHRGLPFRMAGVCAPEKRVLEELFPNRFVFESREGSFDYVYDVNDLADLKGKKFHGKRNHLHRFRDAYPHFRVEPLCEHNLDRVKDFAAVWYAEKRADNPELDIDMEEIALFRALDSLDVLDADGLVLFDGQSVLAFTLGTRMSDDTVDVHFEKARADVRGAYTAINCEFARHIRNRYPNVRFLDREEDMGLEGLRRAKQSYHPHHRVEKFTVTLAEDAHV